MSTETGSWRIKKQDRGGKRLPKGQSFEALVEKEEKKRKKRRSKSYTPDAQRLNLPERPRVIRAAKKSLLRQLELTEEGSNK